MAFLIDKYLPKYTYHEYHERVIYASAEKCFMAAKHLNMSGSFITKGLIKLRGLPAKDLTLQGFIKENCFIYLAEAPYNEFVIEASQHNTQIVWNFCFKEIEDNKTLVSTETRISCLTKRSKIFFSFYWFFVKPFSGIIRLEMLRLIRKKAESTR